MPQTRVFFERLCKAVMTTVATVFGADVALVRITYSALDVPSLSVAGFATVG